MKVMSRGGRELVEGAESLRQRLADALAVRRGSVPANRDYGSLAVDVVDRNVDGDLVAAVSAQVADAVRHPPNGLGDLRIRSVTVRQESNSILVGVRGVFAGAEIEAQVSL